MRRRTRVVMAGVMLMLTASCQGEPATISVEPPPAIGLIVSDAAGPVGGRIVVQIMLPPEPALDGAHLHLRYDPRRLEYRGQVPGSTLVLVNAADSARGELGVLALDPAGLAPRFGDLVFVVRAPEYLPSLGVAPVELVTADLQVLPQGRAGFVVGVDSSLHPSASARPMLLEDWIPLLYVDAADGWNPELARSPGQYVPGLRYGDATLNGVVSTLDAAVTANVAVGNFALIAGTESPSRDFAVAANVRPSNLPGLGEDGDPLPPGVEAGGLRRITVLDAAVISNEAVGNDQTVAGEFIPGREPRPTDRVILAGDVTADRTLTRDTIYELQGTVNVVGGVRLTIRAGTRIEGDSVTRGQLVVRRGGDLVARGTFLEPIVFTCVNGVPGPGCWGGVVINGFSLLNNGSGTSSGDGGIGCPEKVGVGGTGIYGGCLVDDTSGVLRYVRIEHAGQPPLSGGGAVPGLALLGVGRGTVVDSVQVHGAAGDGLFVSGGTVDLRNVMLTDARGAGLRWNDGWVGRAQFLIVQPGAAGAGALVGSNADADPDVLPRSAPRFSHVTVAGPGPGAGSAVGLRLENGTDFRLWNAIVLGSGGVGLDVDGEATCARLGAGIQIESSIFFNGAPDFSDDDDCADEAAFALDPARGNRVVDPALISAASTATPDFRPAVGSPALQGYALPPADGFFDLSAVFVGAVAGAELTGGNIPWYAGWTRGWVAIP
jgi:hypothetical protein